MKHSIRFFAVFFGVIIFGLNNLQAIDYNFRLNLKKGEHFNYVFTSTDQVDQNTKDRPPISARQKSSLAFSLKVVDRLKSGNFQMEVDYTHFETVMTINGNNSSYNSDSTYHSNKLADLLKDMTSIKLNFEVSPLGVISNLTGLEELTKKIDTSMRLANLLKGIGTPEFISELLNYFPQGKVEPGAEWSVHTSLPELKQLKYDMNYTFAKVEADRVLFNFNSKFSYKQPEPVGNESSDLQMKETIKQDGNLVLNSRTNLPQTSVLNQVVDVVVTHTDHRTLVVTQTPMKIITENSLKLLKSD